VAGVITIDAARWVALANEASQSILLSPVPDRC